MENNQPAANVIFKTSPDDSKSQGEAKNPAGWYDCSENVRKKIAKGKSYVKMEARFRQKHKKIGSVRSIGVGRDNVSQVDHLYCF